MEEVNFKDLIDEGFNNLSYLDISKEACKKSKIALGMINLK